MSKSTTKTTTAAPSHNVKFKPVKKSPAVAVKNVVNNEATRAANAVLTSAKPPSLQDLIAGKGDAVQKAVAERVGAKEAAAPKIEKKETTKKAAEKKSKKATERKETVAGFMRRLITEGKNNEEVFEGAVKEFGVGDEKKSYPSWYRSEMKRKSNAARAEAKKTSVAPKKDLPKVEKVPTKKVNAKA